MSNGHPFEGLWVPIAAELDGEPAPREFTDHAEVELADGAYVVRYGGVAADRGSYFLEEAGLTLVGMHGPNAGKTIPCLHRFDGEHLVVCYGLGGVRPAEFTTAGGDRRYLATYRRKA
jgi:uncharacterized protein (TIGR03067 family)